MPPSSLASAQTKQDKPKPEQQDEPIRLKSDLVEVRAVVTDKQGNVIKGLTKDAFEIIENNKPQDISFFSVESLITTKTQVDLTAPSQPQPTPTQNPEIREPGRTIVFFIDTLHLSNSSMLRMREVLLKFINERLTERDVAAVVTSSGNLGIFSQLTQDKQILITALTKLFTSPDLQGDSFFTPFLAAKLEQGAPYALDAAVNIVMAEEGFSDDPNLRQMIVSRAQQRARQIISEATHRRRSTLLTLRAVAERLAEMPGQRLIVMLSDGFTMLDNAGIVDSSDLDLVVGRAARSGVVIYTLGTKGLIASSLYDSSRKTRFSPDTNIVAVATLITAGDRELEHGLSRIAKQTGGQSFLTTNDLRGALEKTLDENSFYYALSYYSSSNDDRKSQRKIKVRVKGHPEYEVRAQTGYLASDRKTNLVAEIVDPQKRLLQAMNAPLATTQIEIDASADFLYIQADDSQVSLNVYADVGKLKYAEEEKNLVAKLAVLIEVLNTGGNAENITEDTMQIRLTPEQYQQAQKDVYRYTKRMKLKPGLYQIRVGVRDQNADLIGTSATWVDVPNLQSKKLALSGILLTRPLVSKTETQGQPKENLIQPSIKRGTSLFRKADSIIYFSRAYNAALVQNESAGLQVHAQIFQGDKVVLEDEWRPLSSSIISKEGDSADFSGRLKLETLQPGSYELRVMIADQKSKPVATTIKAFEIE
jgi:VWFA-related protein